MISAIFRTVLGALFGLACALVLSPAMAAFQFEDSAFASILTLIIVACVAALGLFAPTIRRALGRGFLLLGLTFFALPISSLLLAGRAASEVVAVASETASSADQAAAVIGAGLGAAMLTGLGTFFGIILGIIFTVLGLVLALGGRREVIVVEKE